MFQTITDITLGPTYLQQPIDNRNGELRIGLRSITYAVGWYNIHESQSIIGGRSNISPGLWTFDDLSSLMEAAVPGMSIAVSKLTGKASIRVPSNTAIVLPRAICDLLGFDDGRLSFPGEEGQRPVNFSPHRLLYVHCDQLNTSNIALNGAPSDLLAVVAVGGWSYGEIKTAAFPSPEFKLLRTGTISELTFTVRDERGNIIDNHGLPVSIVLELK